MEKITIYQNPSCTTCRNVYNALKEAGADFNAVNYYLEPLTKEQLKTLLRKMNIPARELLRVKDKLYFELKLAAANLSEDRLIELMSKHPDLMQRPIVEKGNRAILARPAEKIKEIL